MPAQSLRSNSTMSASDYENKHPLGFINTKHGKSRVQKVCLIPNISHCTI